VDCVEHVCFQLVAFECGSGAALSLHNACNVEEHGALDACIGLWRSDCVKGHARPEGLANDGRDDCQG